MGVPRFAIVIRASDTPCSGYELCVASGARCVVVPVLCWLHGGVLLVGERDGSSPAFVCDHRERCWGLDGVTAGLTWRWGTGAACFSNSGASVSVLRVAFVSPGSGSLVAAPIGGVFAFSRVVVTEVRRVYREESGGVYVVSWALSWCLGGAGGGRLASRFRSADVAEPASLSGGYPCS